MGETKSFFAKAYLYFIQQGIPGCRFLSTNFDLDRHQFEESEKRNESNDCQILGKVF